MATRWGGVVAPRSGRVKRSVHFLRHCSAILAAAEQRFNHSHKGGATMNKCVVGAIVLVLVTCGWGTMSVGEQMPAPRGELRIVDKSPMNWAYIVVNVFEHLVEISKEGTLVPGLATRCISATGSFTRNSAGARRTGEFSTYRARGAQDRISWSKGLPLRTSGRTRWPWRPTWRIGIPPGFPGWNGLSLTTP